MLCVKVVVHVVSGAPCVCGWEPPLATPALLHTHTHTYVRIYVHVPALWRIHRVEAPVSARKNNTKQRREKEGFGIGGVVGDLTACLLYLWSSSRTDSRARAALATDGRRAEQ